ncbi:MAG: hypothetical protein LBG78_01375 [Azoarcus sp.]|jgi:hypothetical protein|nr:hypothetical protein [Azoarcus sp.]
MDTIDFRIEHFKKKPVILSQYILSIKIWWIFLKLYKLRFPNLPNNILADIFNITDLDCSCHNEGCWPFLIKIQIRDNMVTWGDYEQSHRARNSASGFWDYSDLRKFEFDYLDYKNKLKILSVQISDRLAHYGLL